MLDWLADAVSYAERWIGYQVRATQLPGCVLAVARHGELVAERAFGVADLRTGEALTPRHRFRVASHSKTFTAAGILKLREDGRLHFDDPVGRHVAGLDAATGSATLAQLLTHTAGLMRDGRDAPHWLDRHPFFDEPALRTELGEPPTIEANTRFKYSNLGFGLLGLVIEAVTGEPYGTWIGRTIVAPSGLADTASDTPLPEGTPFAAGHGGLLPAGRRFPIPGRNPTAALAAATGFVSTACDLARFFGSLDPAAPRSVLSVASRREMVRRHWRLPHSTQDLHYGLGTMAGSLDGHDWFGHGGAFPGFISRTLAVPEWGVTVSVVTNAIDGFANPWAEGVLGIMHRFSRHGAPRPAVAGWSGRWWTIWRAIDLVPMGDRVLVATPDLLAPFTDAAEIEVSSPTEGRITLATGFGGHGEPVSRVSGPDGTPERLHVAGSAMVPEAEMLEEIAVRAAS